MPRMASSPIPRKELVESGTETESNAGAVAVEQLFALATSLQAKKNPRLFLILGLILKAWQFPTFAWQPATLSSALKGFTSEFGMGSGGSLSLCSPSKLVC